MRDGIGFYQPVGCHTHLRSTMSQYKTCDTPGREARTIRTLLFYDSLELVETTVPSIVPWRLGPRNNFFFYIVFEICNVSATQDYDRPPIYSADDWTNGMIIVI